MRTIFLSPAKPLDKVTPKLLGHLFPKMSLTRLIQKAPLEELSPQQVAKKYHCLEQEKISRLFDRIGRMTRTLYEKGAIDSARRQALLDWLWSVDAQAIEEQLSPYHALLSEKDFYRLSDPLTRRLLRRSAARFARQHRLPPESAALLWKGETTAPSHSLALLLLLPIPFTIAIEILLFQWLPLSAALLSLIALPSIFEGFYLLTITLVQKLLPSSPLPLLATGEGHPLSVVGIGHMKDPDSALAGMARIIAAGHSDCQYTLLLTRSDALLADCAGESDAQDRLRTQAKKLEERLDCSIHLIFAPRSYDPNKKIWKGSPSYAQLAKLIAQECPSSIDAVCILPTQGTILPGTPERLAAALFHPFSNADSLVFLSPTSSPLPHDRLINQRQCLLQKMDAPADFNGYGILRRDALDLVASAPESAQRSSLLSPRLSAETLLSPTPLPPLTTPQQSAPSLLRWLSLLLACVRPLILFAMIAARIAPIPLLFLCILSSADLIAAALLAFPRGAKHFLLSTLPALCQLGKEFLNRLLFPLRDAWKQYPLGGHVGLYLFSLLFGGITLALRAPLSIVGFVWIIAPLLTPGSEHTSFLTATEKAACHGLAEEIYTYLSKDALFTQGQADGVLPPAYRTPDGECAPYTTPATLATQAVSILSAYDLGLCDPHTLQRQVAHILTQLEALPTKCGLPYARYSTETGEYYKDSHVDSAECGLYALCLAALEAGLWEYASRFPSLESLAKRTARLSAQMDFTLLLDKRGRLCETLSPTGEQIGALSYLCGKGGITLFAALASDSLLATNSTLSTVSQKKAAFRALLAPTALLKGHCLILSPQGALQDYLLPLLLLPIPPGSLQDFAANAAIGCIWRERKKEGKRNFLKRFFSLWQNKNDAKSFSFPHLAHTGGRIFRRLIAWPRFFGGERLLSAGSASLQATSHNLNKSDKAPEEITAPLLCLLLHKKPQLALAHLQKLQNTDWLGGFADPAQPHQIPLTGLHLSLIALAGAVKGKGFRHRVEALPRCGMLAPLLHTSPASIVGQGSAEPLPVSPPTPTDSPALSQTPSPSPSLLSHSLFLLGDAEHGLLISQGCGLSLWEGGQPITASTHATTLFAKGRLTGLLLKKGNTLLPLPQVATRREPDLLILEGNAMTCTIQRTALGWDMVWERSETDETELRFFFSPACPLGQSVRLTTERSAPKIEGPPHIDLFAELSPLLTLALRLEGIDAPFSHADPSPLPRGSGQALSLFSLPPREASGFCETPSCILGGIWKGQRVALRLVVASNPAVAAKSLQTPKTALSSVKGSPFPLPAPDEGLGTLALTWYLQALFAGCALPTVHAIGSPHLSQCLEDAATLLCEKGFPLAKTLPLPLTVSKREGAERLLIRLLSQPPVPRDAETPLLPAQGKITYPDGFPLIQRGRDLPHLTRTYSNGIATLWADPEALRFSPHAVMEALPLLLCLRQGEKQILLPASAHAISFAPGKAIFSGDGFCLTLALIPHFSLLSLHLTAEADAELLLPTLSAPHKEQEGVCFWYPDTQDVLFSLSWKEKEEKVWLLGSFPRQQDRLYYQMRETVTPHSFHELINNSCKEARAAAEHLIVHTPDFPSLPGIADAVLESPSPVRALLTPLCSPQQARADLLRLASAPPSLLLPAALLIYLALCNDREVTACRIAVEGGEESLYLHAARALEDAMENAPATPLLPFLVTAFAKLSREMGDPTAPLYEAFTPSQPVSTPTGEIDPHWQCSHKTVDLLAHLQRGTLGAVEELLDFIATLPWDPPTTDAALLWSGVLWGILGFAPSQSGAAFRPAKVDRPCEFTLEFGGQWRISLAPDAPPRYFLDDVETEAQNIFIKR